MIPMGSDRFSAMNSSACVSSPLPLLQSAGRERHRHRSRGHQYQDAGGVGTALGVDVGLKQPIDQEPGGVNTSTSGRTAFAHSGAMPYRGR